MLSVVKSNLSLYPSIAVTLDILGFIASPQRINFVNVILKMHEWYFFLKIG